VLGAVLFMVIISIPAPESLGEITKSRSILTISPQIVLGTLVWMIAWWITESVPLGLTGLLAPFIFIISGVLYH
jgi:solute carrier family 13 (sodium-dependent dicarboxylate transporter), member 2/3/5